MCERESKNREREKERGLNNHDLLFLFFFSNTLAVQVTWIGWLDVKEKTGQLINVSCESTLASLCRG